MGNQTKLGLVAGTGLLVLLALIAIQRFGGASPPVPTSIHGGIPTSEEVARDQTFRKLTHQPTIVHPRQTQYLLSPAQQEGWTSGEQTNSPASPVSPAQGQTSRTGYHPF